MQRKASDAVENSAAPPIVREVLNSPGQPLDVGTRSLMESRFGHDFSRVRIHSDVKAVSSARSLGALAYTAGEDVVLGTPYAPHTNQGAWVLGHELAHVVQQRGGTDRVAESGAHEQEAERAARAVVRGGEAKVALRGGAPALQALRVTEGQYGVALEWYTNTFSVPDDVVLLLKKSPTYMGVARTLDRHYVAMEGPEVKALENIGGLWNWEPSRDGVFAKGPFKGRRALGVYWETGTRFEPAGSRANPGVYDYIDVINLAPVNDYGGAAKQLGEYARNIAHESTHALHHVSGSGPSPSDVAAGIRAQIAEEGKTRAGEEKVVSEIQSSPEGAEKLKGYTPEFGSQDAWAIERDLGQFKLRTTYLEHFTLNRLIEQAIAKEGLTDEEVAKRDEEVKEIPLRESSLDSYLTDPFPLYLNEKTGLYEMVSGDYRKFRFWERVIAARWEQFLHEHRVGDPDYEDEKERVLQEHAAAFFEGLVTYTPRPSK